MKSLANGWIPWQNLQFSADTAAKLDDTLELGVLDAVTNFAELLVDIVMELLVMK